MPLPRLPHRALKPTYTQRNTPWVTQPYLIHAQPSIRTQHTTSNTALPRIIQPSIWESILPRSLREKTKSAFQPTTAKKRNPALYFIWIYILIGSQAIRIIGVQNDFNTYMRKAELKIGKLREVVERLQRGEDVDVETALGVGDEESEREWEAALREIENEERVWQENKRKREVEGERAEAQKNDASPVSSVDSSSEDREVKSVSPDLPGSLSRPPMRPGFY